MSDVWRGTVGPKHYLWPDGSWCEVPPPYVAQAAVVTGIDLERKTITVKSVNPIGSDRIDETDK